MPTNEKTELIVILDNSGSMVPFTDDTIGGYNSLIQEQKNKGHEISVTTIVFNKFSKVLNWRVPIEEIEDLNKQKYRIGGMTAILDAVTLNLTNMMNAQIAAGDSFPENRLCFITTDGKENASEHCTLEDMKNTIGKMEKDFGWKFYYMSSDLDAIETAAEFGIDRKRAAYHRQSGDMHNAKFAAMNRIVDNIIYKKDDEEWKKVFEENQDND